MMMLLLLFFDTEFTVAISILTKFILSKIFSLFYLTLHHSALKGNKTRKSSIFNYLSCS